MNLVLRLTMIPTVSQTRFVEPAQTGRHMLISLAVVRRAT